MDRICPIIALVAVVILSSGCLEEEYPAYNVTKNYCGPEGLFGVPNSAPSGASFNSACYDHDRCYAECKTNGKSQAACDQEFRQTMDDSCDAAFDKKMTECDAQGGISSYVCEAGARLSASACWTQASAYHNGVAVGGKAVGSYPC